MNSVLRKLAFFIFAPGIVIFCLGRPCLAATALSYGDNASGAISAAAEKDEFTFTGASADVVDIRFAKSSSGSFSPQVKLYSPSGVLLDSSITNKISRTLTASGTFKITVEAFGGSNTGTYNLNLEKRNNPVSAVNLNFGDTVSGALNSFASLLVYKISAAANDKVFVNYAELDATGGTLDPSCELYNASGALIASSIFAPFAATINYSGDAYLFITDYGYNGTGTLEVTLQRANNPANPAVLNFDSLREDILDAVTKINAYRFDAAAGQTLTLCSGVKNVTSGSFSLFLELYDASGNRLVNTNLGNFKQTFANAGTYYLFVYNDYESGTGIYKCILKNGDFSCFGMDLIDPQVSLSRPQDGELVEAGSSYTVTWSASDNTGITSQEIRLSIDSGASFPTVIASGLSSSARSYNWQVPADLISAEARVKVIARDAQGNQGYAANSNNFIIINSSLPAGSSEVSYEYDKLNRLTKSDSVSEYHSEYAYDPLGNRLSLKSQGPEYSSSSVIIADLNGNGKDEIIINFGPAYGIWIKYDDGTWGQLHPLSPKAMGQADLDADGLADIIIDFGPAYGIWVRYGSGTWQQLHNLSPKFFVPGVRNGSADKGIIFDFGPVYGIWEYSNSAGWSCLHNLSAKSIVIADLDADNLDDAVIDFGPSYGIWVRYGSGAWQQLHSLSPKFMIPAGMDANPKGDLVIDFGPQYGIWVYANNSTWSQPHSLSADSILAADLDANAKDDLVIDFGPNYGIWARFDSGAWRQLHNLSPDFMVSGKLDSSPKDDLAVDFGDNYGLWGYYNDSTWQQIHNLSP